MGQKVANPRYESVSVRFDEEEKIRLQRLARLYKESLAATIRRAVNVAFPEVLTHEHKS